MRKGNVNLLTDEFNNVSIQVFLTDSFSYEYEINEKTYISNHQNYNFCLAINNILEVKESLTFHSKQILKIAKGKKFVYGLLRINEKYTTLDFFNTLKDCKTFQQITNN